MRYLTLNEVLRLYQDIIQHVYRLRHAHKAKGVDGCLFTG
jgi:hypothetical protein